MDITERICRAYAWQHALGHEMIPLPLCRMVRDLDLPEIWDANHVSEVRGRTPKEIDRVLEETEEVFRHCRHRLFIIDPLTPDSFLARLKKDGFQDQSPIVQMVLEGRLKGNPPDMDLRPVTSEEDWRSLQALVRQDHLEGARTQAEALTAEVTQGMVASYRKKSPVYQFFLARKDGLDLAYGAGVLCENGMGMVEDLFTLPGYRRQGIATAIIARAIDHVQALGAEQIQIGALLEADVPKQLYASLGFKPVCITQKFIKP